ncbi:MAG: hypothetical protein GY851_29595 [bacterium]|nr:hypothetical protein [bacterium]
MSEDTQSIEEALEVGRAVIFHAAERQSEGARIKTFIRGWQRGSYILLDVAETAKAPLLHEGQECVLRFVALGKVYGFSAAVKDVGMGSFNTCVRVSWPHDVSAIRIRQEERVSTQAPCTVLSEIGAEAVGEIQDVSAMGCRVASPLVTQKGTSVRLSFALPDGTTIDKVQALVQNVSPYPGGTYLGCKFEFEDDSISQELRLYVLATLDRMRGERPGEGRIVIMESDADTVIDLRGVLQETGYDVAMATDMVDGFFLLRLTKPGALLVSATLPDLGGVDVCRLVKSKERFKDLPVFVYGGKADTVAGQAEKAGASAYFPSLEALGKVTKAITEAFPPPPKPEDAEEALKASGEPEASPQPEAKPEAEAAPAE